MSADPGCARLDEAAARRLLLLRACETQAVPASLWSPEDGAWASRLAAETVPADASDARFLDERARHACERLLPRDRSLGAALRRRGLPGAWLLAAAGLGALAGALADSVGAAQRIDLLAVPVAALLLWNLLVYAAIAVQALRPAAGGALRRWLSRRLQPRTGVLPAFSADWAQRSAPLNGARAALLLHLASAGLAAGLVAGLYARGLVLDYRAGWQSTFLDADAVYRLLSWVYAPAAALTGIGVPPAPALAALQVGPGTAASAPAAPWIHLQATTLALFVLLPRGLLALRAALTAWRLSRRFPLSLAEPYFQRLLQTRRRAEAQVQVLPHGGAPTAQAVLGLRALLAAAFGDGVQLSVAPATAHGDEDGAPQAGTGTTLRLALVDLAATPEAEAQGRFLARLQAGAAPLWLLADETTFRRRFAGVPARLAERRQAWQRLAQAHGVRFLGVELERPQAPELAAAAAALLAP